MASLRMWKGGLTRSYLVSSSRVKGMRVRIKNVGDDSVPSVELTMAIVSIYSSALVHEVLLEKGRHTVVGLGRGKAIV